MEEPGDFYREKKSLIQEFKDALLWPLRVATSPALLRTYLRTLVLLITSSILFAIAVVAYTSFYVSYIPVRGISVPIYLQYDYVQPEVYNHQVGLQHKWPFGLANVKGLVSRQKYDVVVEMEVPRSERNVKVGNWMVGLEMRGPGQGLPGVVKNMLGWEEEWAEQDDMYGVGTKKKEEEATAASPGVVAKELEKPVVLARSRRPAVLTYRSWMTEMAYRVLRLPLYVVGWAQESETVRLAMMEDIEFERGSRTVPSSVRIELKSPQRLEVYRVTLRFIAKLEGLRYIMYHYKISSFIFFTTLYWAVEVSVVLFTWGVFSLLTSSSTKAQDNQQDIDKTKFKQDAESIKKLKQEPDTATTTTPITPKTETPWDDEDPETLLSDTPRTFPTLPSQPPLHYTSSSSAPERDRTGQQQHIKQEEDNSTTQRLEDIPLASTSGNLEGAEYGDDEEDEDADFVLEETGGYRAVEDSGIGTSMESSHERASSVGLQRRRSGWGGGGGGGGKRE